MEHQFEDLQKPELQEIPNQEAVKLTILNAKKSSALSIWLIAFPVCFLSLVLMKYLFHWNFAFLDLFIQAFQDLDRIPFLSPLLFLLAPLITIVLNFVSITHLNYDRKALYLTVYWRWTNIAFILIAGLVLLVFSTYLITENLIPKK